MLLCNLAKFSVKKPNWCLYPNVYPKIKLKLKSGKQCGTQSALNERFGLKSSVDNCKFISPIWRLCVKVEGRTKMSAANAYTNTGASSRSDDLVHALHSANAGWL